jgi:hypothetical protein
MTYTKPVYMGKFRPMKASDVEDRYLDITGDLTTGETISSVTFAVVDSAGDAVTGVTSNTSLSDARVGFRVTAPATAGVYTLTAVCVISDGQTVTREATIIVV